MHDEITSQPGGAIKTHDDVIGDISDLAELLQGDQGPSDADRAVHRRRRGIALLVTAIVLVVILGGAGGYVWWALSAPLPAPKASAHTPDPPVGAAAAIVLPETGASALVLSGGEEYLGDTAGIWAQSGSDGPRAMASISKLVTALVVLEAKPLADPTDPGPTIRFSKADHDLYDVYYVRGASIAAMPTGSTMSERDAIAMMLVPSASNYADAVSTWAFGSRAAFLRAARAWLANNGLTGTTVVEPTGISPKNVSTPADLLALGRLAAANPVVATIVKLRSITIPALGTFSNTNDLLGVEGITGLKTGNLGQDTYNLLYTASLDVGLTEPLSVIGVRLGGATREAADTEVRRLLASIREGFHRVEVAGSGQLVGHLETPWGGEAQMVIPISASLLTWSDTPIEVTMQTRTPKTYADGEVVGSITWTAGPETVTGDIRLDGTVGQPDVWWRLTNPGLLGRG